jgi:nitroimidazol reductase NimA-like FMN-containing flavoprotein (pyridoxamine 5'-phosphate oxidase superfamily)
MKIFEGEKGIGMPEGEARKFLTQSRSTLLLGTTNADGSPVIHPVWYYFDSATTRLYFYTEPVLRKANNVRERSLVYFDVDSDKWPYKGVKGKGKARILTDRKEALSLGSKILAKYVKKGQPLMKSVLDKIEGGGYIVIEIRPAYFTTWDYARVGLPDAVIS